MGRYYGLDMLRGIAAIMVAVNHGAFLGGGWTIFSHSFLAVDFFFLLSGFVISAAFEGKMPELGAQKFLAKRISRLWPPIAVGILISLIFKLIAGDNSHLTIYQIFLALAFLPTIDGNFNFNNPMWSIHFEIFANIIHFFLLRRLSNLNLLFLSGLSAAVLLFATGIYDADVGQGDKYLLGFPRVMLSYTLGIVLWRVNSATPRGTAMLSFTLLPASIIIASYVGWADYLVILFLNPVILLSGLQLTQAGKFASVAQFMGAWSFPLYALHWPFQELMLWIGQDWVSATLWSMFLSLIIGMAVDQRLRRSVGLDLNFAKHGT